MQRCLKSLLLAGLIYFSGLTVYGQQSLRLNLKLISKEYDRPVAFAKISLINMRGETHWAGLSDTEGKCL